MSEMASVEDRMLRLIRRWREKEAAARHFIEDNRTNERARGLLGGMAIQESSYKECADALEELIGTAARP